VLRVIAIFIDREEITDTAARISLLLYRLSQGINKMIKEEGKEKGISSTQVQTLLFLSSAHPRNKNISSIAKRLNIAQPTSSRAIDSLERKGLVAKQRSIEDNRKVKLSLTDKGTEIADNFTDLSKPLQHIIGKLDQADLSNLNRSLTDILGQMQKRGDVSASLTCRYCRYFDPGGGKSDEYPHHCNLTGEDLSEEESWMEWVHGKERIAMIERDTVQ